MKARDYFKKKSLEKKIKKINYGKNKKKFTEKKTRVREYIISIKSKKIYYS